MENTNLEIILNNTKIENKFIDQKYEYLKEAYLKIASEFMKNTSLHNLVSIQPIPYEMKEVPLVFNGEQIESISVKDKVLKTLIQGDFQSLDKEFFNILYQEITMQIIRDIINDIRNNAGIKEVFDFNNSLGDTISEKYESLYVKIAETSNTIGGSNWIVTSPEVAAIFEASSGFSFSPSIKDFSTTLGINYLGTINSRWRLYKDPLFPTNTLLLGYKGDSPYDSSYVYCPRLIATQVKSKLPNKGVVVGKANETNLKTSYASTMIDKNKYAVINFKNFYI